MKKTMLALRKTPAGEEYYEVSNERGAMLATKNHQGGLDDQDDESIQRPRSPCKSFNPAKDEVWFCSVPLGHNSLENMPRGMTTAVFDKSLDQGNHCDGFISSKLRESTHKSDNWSPK